MISRGLKSLVVAATVAASLALGQAHAAAADITVDVLTDTGGTAAECQLRDAIASANTGAAVDGCEAGTNNGSDNIFFTVTGTITLSGGPLNIDANEPVQFFGPEDEINLTISGGSTQGIIDAAAPIRLDSIGLTQAQRSGNGGGISSTSSVEMFNVSMDNLRTTGGSGGCVYAASVSVTQSTLSHNDAAANGGCLNTTGGASIVNSNFMDNEAELDAGGAIASLGGTLTVTESTFGEHQPPPTRTSPTGVERSTRSRSSTSRARRSWATRPRIPPRSAARSTTPPGSAARSPTRPSSATSPTPPAAASPHRARR